MNKVHSIATAAFFAACFLVLRGLALGHLRDTATVLSLGGLLAAWVAAMQFGGRFDR